MYIITLNRFLDPVVVWVDQSPDQARTAHGDGQCLLTLSTAEEAHDVAKHLLDLLDYGREAALIFQPSLVT
jgi:hypothetical protein